MKHGIVTCHEPKDSTAIYMRNLYHEFFWGPFKDEHECAAAIAALDKADSYWDYDPFCMIYGADPLPKDFVFGFPSVPDDTRQRIIAEARPNGRMID